MLGFGVFVCTLWEGAHAVAFPGGSRFCRAEGVVLTKWESLMNVQKGLEKADSVVQSGYQPQPVWLALERASAVPMTSGRNSEQQDLLCIVHHMGPATPT